MKAPGHDANAFKHAAEAVRRLPEAERRVVDRLTPAPVSGSDSASHDVPSRPSVYSALQRAQGVQPQDVGEPGRDRTSGLRLRGQAVRSIHDDDGQAWSFVMVLGFSRHMVVRVVFDQRTETWLQLHDGAFAELGGVVETVVPDNLKAAVVRAAFAIDDQSELNRSYRELAGHYGFKVDPRPPYDAQKKSKVEAGVMYLKGDFFVGRQQSDVEEVRRDLRRWVQVDRGHTQAWHDRQAARASNSKRSNERIVAAAGASVGAGDLATCQGPSRLTHRVRQAFVLGPVEAAWATRVGPSVLAYASDLCR
jgi:hypothetical protein